AEFGWHSSTTTGRCRSLTRIELMFKIVPFSSLKPNESDEILKSNRKPFQCPKCSTEMYLSVLESARHLEVCSKQSTSSSEKDAPKQRQRTDSGRGDDVTEQNRADLKEYYCSDCNRTLWLSSIN